MCRPPRATNRLLTPIGVIRDGASSVGISLFLEQPGQGDAGGDQGNQGEGSGGTYTLSSRIRRRSAGVIDAGTVPASDRILARHRGQFCGLSATARGRNRFESWNRQVAKDYIHPQQESFRRVQQGDHDVGGRLALALAAAAMVMTPAIGLAAAGKQRPPAISLSFDKISSFTPASARSPAGGDFRRPRQSRSPISNSLRRRRQGPSFAASSRGPRPRRADSGAPGRGRGRLAGRPT